MNQLLSICFWNMVIKNVMPTQQVHLARWSIRKTHARSPFLWIIWPRIRPGHPISLSPIFTSLFYRKGILKNIFIPLFLHAEVCPCYMDQPLLLDWDQCVYVKPHDSQILWTKPCTTITKKLFCINCSRYCRMVHWWYGHSMLFLIKSSMFLVLLYVGIIKAVA